MPHRTLSIVTLVLVSVFARTNALAADRCAARVNAKTGAIEVNASGVSGTPTWSGSPAVEGIGFANASTCVAGDRLRRCRLGDPDTLAAITPPSECRVCVHDDDAACCAVIRGCTPGPRLKDASFAAGDPRVCQGFGAADPACGPVGIWERTNGLLLLGYISTVDLLVLRSDGTATLSSRRNAGIECARALHAKGAGNDLILDSSTSGFGGAKLFQFRSRNENELALVDGSGATTTFVRHVEVPTDLGCDEPQVLARFSNLPRGRGAALAFDGTALWYSDDEGHEISVDPATGAAGPTLDLPGIVAAAAGQTFWMTQVDPARRQDTTRVGRNGAVLDVVTTPAIAGDEPSIGGVAVDPQSDRIFLTANAQDGTDPLFGVRTAGEPDTFTTLGDLAEPFGALAFDGQDLWTIPFRSNNLVRIDAQTGARLQTFLLPGGTVRWSGVAPVNGDLFVLGQEFTPDLQQASVIVRVRP